MRGKARMSSGATGEGGNPGTADIAVPSHASARDTSVVAAEHGTFTGHANRDVSISSKHSIIAMTASMAPSVHLPSTIGFGTGSFCGASVVSS